MLCMKDSVTENLLGAEPAGIVDKMASWSFAYSKKKEHINIILSCKSGQW